MNRELTGEFNLHTSNNPSPVGGQGGTCFGDSGGGVFLNDTNIVVAVVSFGTNDDCKGSDYSARADIADTQDFVRSFLEEAPAPQQASATRGARNAHHH